MKHEMIAIVALALAACSDPSAQWTEVLDRDDLDRVLLSAWGSSPGDVYLAGGDLGGPMGPLILHYDGSDWREITTDASATFWWVWGTYAAGSQGDVFAVGEEGIIYRIASGSAMAMTSPTTENLFGVWGESSSELWAVGGNPVSADPTSVILRYDGSQWIDETPAVASEGALFKVWGSSPANLFAVGQNGTVLHYDGSTWSKQESGTGATLFTAFGTGANDVYAVGGPPGTVIHYDGSEWNPVDTGIPAQVLNGVAATASGEVVVVGSSGAKMRFTGGEWVDEGPQRPFIDLHAVWLDEGGEGYAVGGNFNAPRGSQRVGSVGYYGTKPPPGAIAGQ